MMLRSLLLISIATGALAGCGLKGPLYLPKQEGQEVSSQDREDQKRERTRDSGAQVPAAGDTGTPPPTVPREN